MMNHFEVQILLVLLYWASVKIGRLQDHLIDYSGKSEILFNRTRN